MALPASPGVVLWVRGAARLAASPGACSSSSMPARLHVGMAMFELGTDPDADRISIFWFVVHKGQPTGYRNECLMHLVLLVTA